MGLEQMVNRYIITTAQRGAAPHRTFLNGLINMADFYGAELMILPTNGKDPTSKKSQDRDTVVHPDLQQFSIIDGDYALHKHLDIRKFPVKAQQIDPITGWSRFVQADKSAIYASPKQRMLVVPNSNTEMPKVLMTTGAVTLPYYRDGNWDTKATLDHVFGAIVVEVDGDYYHYRQIQANKQGRFADLSTEFFGKEEPVIVRPDAMVLGDIHRDSLNPTVWETTKGMIEQYQPKKIIIHDLFDGRSISHHHEHDLVIRAVKSKEQEDSLWGELYRCGEFLDELREVSPDDVKIYVVKSNHDEFLDRYLREGRFSTDPKNLELSCQLTMDMIEGKDPLQWGIGYTYGDVPRVHFLDRNADLKVRGYQLANHGDMGANGARGSPRSIENATGKSVTGHTHSPQIQRDVWIVGTSTHLKLEYNKGASSWLNTHAFIYPHGKPQLVNIIDGEYTSD